MDCLKCGYTLAPLETACPRCRRIAQEEFARSPASVWPPVIGPAVVEAAPALRPAPVSPARHFEDTTPENSSGEERGCPLEIAELHWNWGAFFCGWLWCFLNASAGLALLVLGVGALLVYFTVALLPSGYALPSELLALVLFGLHCHLGLRGHVFAWERRRFYGGLAQYFSVQRAWSLGGGIVFGLTVSCLTVLFLASWKAFNAYEARRQHPAPAAAPVAASAPPPMVLRAAPPPGPQFSSPPIYGRQGLRHPWDSTWPPRPRYRVGYGPGEVRTPPGGSGLPAGGQAGSPPEAVPVSPSFAPPAFPSSPSAPLPVGGSPMQINPGQTNPGQTNPGQTNPGQTSSGSRPAPGSADPFTNASVPGTYSGVPSAGASSGSVPGSTP